LFCFVLEGLEVRIGSGGVEAAAPADDEGGVDVLFWLQVGGVAAVTGSLAYGGLSIGVVGEPVDLIAHQIIINPSYTLTSYLFPAAHNTLPLEKHASMEYGPIPFQADHSIIMSACP
jgi:hypothetical protein